MTNRFDLTYSIEKIWGKDLFVFVNHKVAPLCWARLKKIAGVCDVVSFDSHRDYSDGVIIRGDAEKLSNSATAESALYSKYNRNGLPHFTSSNEFMDWDLLDDEKNKEIVEREHKYFKPINDNFIDVAFMKNIVENVHCYYLNSDNRANSGKCDDIYGKDHFFTMTNIAEFKVPVNRFILDIDLDFFSKIDHEITGIRELIPEIEIRKYLSLMKSLGKRENCVGVTIALEPDCCGSEENCLRICGVVSEVFRKEILSIAKPLLNV